MPPMSHGALPSSSHSPIQQERRFSGPSEAGAKSARYLAFTKLVATAPGKQHAPQTDRFDANCYYSARRPADYYRSTSPSHQYYRWPPPAPLDEPGHPPPHPNYRRDSWDYRFREPAAGPPPASFPPIRSLSPFP
jgi:hypothetical protein